jgi:hypothetical protein
VGPRLLTRFRPAIPLKFPQGALLIREKTENRLAVRPGGCPKRGKMGLGDSVGGTVNFLDRDHWNGFPFVVTDGSLQRLFFSDVGMVIHV